MEITRQIGIRMVLDSSSISTQIPQATHEFSRMRSAVEDAARSGTRNLTQLSLSLRDIVVGSAGLSLVSNAITGIANAITSLPRAGFSFTKEIEVAEMGMAGIMGSMTAINGQQTTFHQGLSVSSSMIRQLNDDALRTAASSQELVSVFQAIMAPGLAARMSLDEIRQLTVVGTNAVKSMGLDAGQVVQELRDLVAGGITPASSMLANALGLKDSDITAAKASSEGLFTFLMSRLKGFEASTQAYSGTIKGQFDQLQEGATRVAAAGMAPLTAAIKESVGEASKLVLTFDQAGSAKLNTQLVEGIRGYAEGAASALRVTRDVVSGLWEHREAITAVAGAYATFRIGQWAAEAVSAVRAQMDLAQAARLARVEAAAQAAGNVEVVATSRQKVAALLAEMQARQAAAQADAAAATAQITQLAQTREAIATSRAEVVAKMEAARATMVQAEAQIQAARAAGAQSFALATVREATTSLTVAQARHAALMGELAVLGQQQARVQAAVTAATVAQTTATNAAVTATAGLSAAKGAASIAARGFGVVVGALGGPVGIAIMAVSGLAMWLYKLKSAADEAAAAGVQIERAEKTAAAGGRPEDRDIAPLRAALEDWKKKRDELLASGEDSSTEWVNGAQVKSTVKSLDDGIANMEKRLEVLNKASERTSAVTQNVTLTVAGTEQAWKKATDGIKTASAAQEEYQQKLQVTRQAFATHKAMLEKDGASPDVIKKAQAGQLEVEAALAKSRDQQLKGVNGSGAGIARAERRDIDARIEGIKHGYKLMAMQTADGVDAIDSLRKQEQLSDIAAVQQKRDLQLKDLSNQEDALQRELALVRQKKDSAKEQQTLEGQLSEARQRRINIQNKAERDVQELQLAPQISLLATTRQATESIHEQAEALEAQNVVHGKAKSALIDLTIAQLESQRIDLEATNSVVPGYIEAVENRIDALKRLRTATGVTEGLEAKDALVKKVEDQARKTSEDFRGIFRQGVVDALSGGDDLFKSFGDSLKRTVVTSIADALYDKTLKPAVDGFAKFMGEVLSGGSGIKASTAGGGQASGASGLGAVGTLFRGLGAMVGIASAKGNVFASPGLHSYANSVVDKPTVFPFAKGIGLMGEAGAEGILPLKRDGQGRLGVMAQGAGGSAGGLHFAPINTFYIDSRSDRGAVLADMGRALQANNENQMDQLKRMKVVQQ